MEPIRFFDCSASFGRRRIIHKGSFWQLDELNRKMVHYGIENALVYHAMASDYEPLEGNMLLLDEIKEQPHLKPVWVVMPHQTGEFPPPGELQAQLKRYDIRAVRLTPGASNASYSLAEWSCGLLFAMLEKCKIPTMLAASQINWNYQILHDVLEAHPLLHLILTDMPYHGARSIYPLMEKFPHLYIETIGFKVFNGIEDGCCRFGSGRFIFGSSAPLYSGGSAAGMVRYAQISDEDKRAISSGNLEKMLGEVDYDCL